MRYESKQAVRKGKVFYINGKAFDLDGVRVLHSGVDTIKQLFNCLLRSDVLEKMARHLEFTPNKPYFLGDIPWLLVRSSKHSGYQFILKNLDEGFVVMCKSFYSEANLNASHLKIEVTPQRIFRSDAKDLTNQLNKIAGLFATQLVESGIAAHLCVDVKGYEIPKDFESRLVTKAKRQFKVNSISQAQYSLNEIATVYGNGQTYTFGTSGGLQFCVYEKDEEAIKGDKIAFWERVWSLTPSAEDGFEPEYKKGDRVHRFEFRFHHSVINEFCFGSTHVKTKEKLIIKNFEQLCEHLTPLFKYALNNFRLQYSSVYIDPMWQLLEEDVEIYPPVQDWFYKRGKKPPTQNSKRNVAFWLGNVIRLMARKRFSVSYIVDYLMSSGLQDDLAHYFGVLQFGQSNELVHMLMVFVQDKLDSHILNGAAA